MASTALLRKTQHILPLVVWGMGITLAVAQNPPQPSQPASELVSPTDNTSSALAPSNQNANAGTQNRAARGDGPNRSQLTSRRTRAASSNRASIPYMVGDNTSGAIGALRVDGTASFLVTHPSFGGNRLNTAENNSPVVADRLYVSYRHFHNANELSVLGFGGIGGRNSLDVDTYTLGIEKTITENSSCEFRLPISEQLTSNIAISQTTGPQISIPLADRKTNVGNLGIIFKLAMFSTEEFYVSSGVGLNLPTAPDVSVQYTVNDPQFPAIGPGGPIGQTVPMNYRLSAITNNETVNLSPFFSAYWQPESRLYGLGFMQVDTPLNQSTFQTDGSTNIAGQQVFAFNSTGQINQQTLMRGNLGLGAWLWRDECDRTIKSCSLLGEFHYTTSLNDADVIGPVVVARDFGTGNSVLNYGNSANRVDLLNAVLGVQTVIGKTVFLNGVVAPLRSGADRAYDFEYSFSMNRLF